MSISRARVRGLVTAALLTSLLSASAWIAIPLPGGVPLTLQVFVVVLIALLLEPAWAFASVAVYLLMGAAGIPVFSGVRGGLGVLFGPTGGYLFGFLAGAWAASMFRVRSTRRSGTTLADGMAAMLVVGIVYAAGLAQLSVVTGMGPVEAAVAGVAPFIVPDAAKAFIAVAIAGSLRSEGVAIRVGASL